MRISKFDRIATGMTVAQIAERSGLKVDRVKELEDAYLSLLGTRVRTESIDAISDGGKYLTALRSVQDEQDKIVEVMVGRLLAGGLNVAVTAIDLSHSGRSAYQAEVSKSKVHGKSLSSFGRGPSRLIALTGAIDSMREVVGIVAPLFPVVDRDAA